MFSTAIVQTLSISSSLLASGGIATLSLFNIPELRSQPASRALPSIRWLFSRGSHLFPEAAALSSAGFIYLAYESLAPGQSALQLLKVVSNSRTINGYLAAAVLSISIGPFTSFVMLPTNFALISMNVEMGGARSEKSQVEGSGSEERRAKDSVNGDGEAAEFTDLSGPQEKTQKESSETDDEKMRSLLDKFSALNWVRAGLVGGGGILGLWIALS
ncbi:hypothetical protein BOTNAR_0465g00050 [Botryotinia narcissicola]|uniref:DUF1772 domain-containing protein n=1 Tax=Botryotinia narcissicola TaxID=278944 RepID=A0A4Z1HV79_9HELO|nr:hypothetical protein BOTNAR_0465g00050 [Botryotinia narcissicola]